MYEVDQHALATQVAAM